MLRSFSNVGAKIRRKIDKIEDVHGDSKREANMPWASPLPPRLPLKIHHITPNPLNPFDTEYPLG